MQSAPKPRRGFSILLWSIALTLVAAGLFPAAAARADEPAAVLAVVSGDVHIQRGGQSLDGSFGAALQAGDVVETGAKAQAAVLFESGQIIELGPGSKISVGALPEKHESQGNEALAQIPDAFSGSLDQFAHTSSDQGALAALPTLRGGPKHDEPTPVSPRNSLVAPGAVHFSWTPVEDAVEYKVILSGPGAAAGSHSTSKPDWTSDDGTFQPGESWTWAVEAVTLDGAVSSEEVSFEVAGHDRADALAGLEAKLEPLLSSGDATREDTAAYLLGSYCRNKGFYNEAIGRLESLVARHPDRKELHEELGFLYQAIGRNDKAAEAYRAALKP